jgi:hypothetical protein
MVSILYIYESRNNFSLASRSHALKKQVISLLSRDICWVSSRSVLLGERVDLSKIKYELTKIYI